MPPELDSRELLAISQAELARAKAECIVTDEIKQWARLYVASEIEKYIAIIASDCPEPYNHAYEICCLACSAMFALQDNEFANHHTLWCAFTDWIEVKPDGELWAVPTMRRAAKEWMATKPEERSLYFDRWLHAELGVPRQLTGS